MLPKNGIIYIDLRYKPLICAIRLATHFNWRFRAIQLSELEFLTVSAKSLFKLNVTIFEYLIGTRDRSR